jgi:hypothetical protein
MNKQENTTVTAPPSPADVRWLMIGLGCIGGLTGALVGLSNTAVVATVLPLIFALIGGGSTILLGFFSLASHRIALLGRSLGVFSVTFLALSLIGSWWRLSPPSDAASIDLASEVQRIEVDTVLYLSGAKQSERTAIVPKVFSSDIQEKELASILSSIKAQCDSLVKIAGTSRTGPQTTGAVPIGRFYRCSAASAQLMQHLKAFDKPAIAKMLSQLYATVTASIDEAESPSQFSDTNVIEQAEQLRVDVETLAALEPLRTQSLIDRLRSVAEFYKKNWREGMGPQTPAAVPLHTADADSSIHDIRPHWLEPAWPRSEPELCHGCGGLANLQLYAV